MNLCNAEGKANFGLVVTVFIVEVTRNIHCSIIKVSILGKQLINIYLL